MNTIISFLILIAAIIFSLFTMPITAKVFGNSANVGFVSTMIMLTVIDLIVRIADLRRTRIEINERLVRPKCGGSFVLAPIWVLALTMAIYIVFTG